MEKLNNWLQSQGQSWQNLFSDFLVLWGGNVCVLMGVGEQVGKACFSPSVNSRTRETTMAFGVIDPNCPERLFLTASTLLILYILKPCFLNMTYILYSFLFVSCHSFLSKRRVEQRFLSASLTAIYVAPRTCLACSSVE